MLANSKNIGWYLNNTHKNKGFTLIELLAVIVVLALVALIATPIILKVIEDAKKSAAVDSAYGYIEAIEFNNTMAEVSEKYKNQQIISQEEVDSVNSKIKVKGDKAVLLENLVINKGIVKSVKMCISGYTVIYNNGTANADKKCHVEEKDAFIKKNNSILGIIAKNNLKNDSTETIVVNDVTYTAHVYNFDGNQVWSNDMIFGDENDLGNASENAKNMIIVKVNGNLIIDKDVKVTTVNTAYGGPKGMLLYVTGTLTNNGNISMTARGAKAAGQNVYLWQNENNDYEYIPAVGAQGGKEHSSGAIETPITGGTGENGNNRQTGGGGSGGGQHGDYYGYFYVYKGGTGTSYSGGSGSGAINENSKEGPTFGREASNIGGAGGVGRVYRYKDTWMGRSAGGGTGNPGGLGAVHTSGNKSNEANTSQYKGNDGTGGLLIIYTDNLNNKNIIEADGVESSCTVIPSGGASGGGSINIFYNKKTSIGQINANGGKSRCYGGAGGAGTVTIGSISSGTFVKDEL